MTDRLSEGGAGDPALALQLPDAPPQNYLRWMSFWRSVRAALADDPAEDEARRTLMSLFADPIAEPIEEIADAITTQAADAQTRGVEAPRSSASPPTATAPPRAVVSPKLSSNGGRYCPCMHRRSAWSRWIDPSLRSGTR